MKNKNNFEWLNPDQDEILYHTKQYKQPKLYTLELLKIFSINNLDINTRLIVDFGCEGGAVTNLFASNYPSIEFLGLDVNPEYVEMSQHYSMKNADFRVFDLYSDIKVLKKYKIDCLF